jgi:hypothetical protein
VFNLNFSFAQKLKITEINSDYERFEHVGDFDYLGDEADLSTFNWVANFTIHLDTIYPKTILKTFEMFREKANKLGANSFRVSDSNIYATGNSKFISISVFYLNRENRMDNFNALKTNNVYLFGFLGHHQSMDGYKIEMGTQNLVIHELEYIKRTLKKDEVLLVHMGKGWKAIEKTITQKVNAPTVFLTFGVFKGLFRRGTILEYPNNFGEYLVRILNERKI